MTRQAFSGRALIESARHQPNALHTPEFRACDANKGKIEGKSSSFAGKNSDFAARIPVVPADCGGFISRTDSLYV